MNLSKDEIKYCNLARSFLNESYECLLIKNILDESYSQKLANILEVEHFMYTKEFEIICGASLVTVELARIKLNQNIKSLEILLEKEAIDFLYECLTKQVRAFKNKRTTRKKIKASLYTEEFKRTCKMANFSHSEVIEVFKEYGLI